MTSPGNNSGSPAKSSLEALLGFTVNQTIADNTLDLRLTSAQVTDLQVLILAAARTNAALAEMHSGHVCAVEIEAKEWLQKCNELSEAISTATLSKLVSIFVSSGSQL